MLVGFLNAFKIMAVGITMLGCIYALWYVITHMVMVN